MSDDNRLAPPGGILLNLGTRNTPNRAVEPAGDTVKRAPKPAKSAMSEPSWTRVLATTIKLWVLRAGRGRVVAAVAVAAVITVAALAFSGVFAGTTAPAAARARAASTPSPAKAVTHPATAPASLTQTAAAVWVADQLSSDAIIACDPALCAVLQAQGVSAGRLMPLKPGSPDPHGATVVVTSASADGQLAGYAPAVVASFGSGSTRIDVREAEPGGAAAYDAALRADLAARMSAGSQLLRNNRIHFTAQDAAQLHAGQVDTRLLATLAALSSQYPFTVTAFEDASPGAAVLYREVSITTGGKNGPAELASALALVQAQVPPYLPAHAAIGHPAAAPATLGIEFAAPSPMGLLTAVLDVDRSLTRPAQGR
ncbi:MAG TPA: hypothetical protein VKG61_04515 [Streptosporangiaceae bacterium]|nr:hypothetical protein [Streptosporangiaceae bacterium]